MNHSEHPGWAALLSPVLSPAPNCPGEFKPLVLLTGKGKGNPNSPQAAQSRVKIWASTGNPVARQLQNHRGWKGTDRSNIPTEQHYNWALGISNSSLFQSRS